jgi:aspartyl-tRNA synthetase
MNFPKRTLTCGEARLAHINQIHTLNGWVHRLRDHGNITFITLRDRYGMTQIVIDDQSPPQTQDLAKILKMEFCVAVTGRVRPRPEGMVNPNMQTGEIEIHVSELTILSQAASLPFMIEDDVKSSEATRLQYRYLDLRSPALQHRLMIRDRVVQSVRSFLAENGFLEIETPTLIKSTPEGARDFLVPSRLQPGSFYALPQSPQLYKQLLMVGGFDRYYQIARCYRDEDPRGDRQPEFTQIDLEMSFVTRDDVLDLTERMMQRAFKVGIGVDLPIPFLRLTYHDAIDRYGTDKPDLRFDLPLLDVTELAAQSEFQAFKDVAAKQGVVKALVVKAAAEQATRKKISEWEEVAKKAGAKGLAWMRVQAGGLEGGIGKFFQHLAPKVIQTLNLSEGDVVFLVADSWMRACKALGAVRLILAQDLNLIETNQFRFLWVVDFPLFEWDDELQQWTPAHHMFSMPKQEYLETLESNPGDVKGELYDLVCNGLELASGSIRIHDPELQQRVFSIVGYPLERARQRFGFLLDAFQFGPPPHGGIAPGLDRLIMIMTKMETIREVIAFPKNTQMASPMDGSPSPVDESQLKELGIHF